MVTRIVIADDHGLVRSGLRTLINSEPGFQVVGEAEDGHVALKVAQKLRPDILLADVSMPGPSGIELASMLRVRQPETHVIVVTMHEDQYMMLEAKSAGASGFVTKRALGSELIEAIRTVSGGGTHFAAGL